MNTERTLRGDIQGLRAVAVGLVLLFHIWPSLLPGGFVGVDIFFVISGYLIVGSLAREAERDGRISLATFYVRRIRRLLPAAMTVLLCVLVAMFLLLPQARWEDTLLQIIASTLYVENWYLADAAVDYLAAENAASPVQHFWSLSIEEQFYIVWPLAVMGLAWIARRRGIATRPLIGAALVAVFVCSFASSVLLTASNPEGAYFVTHTRAWELALGGLMAVWLPSLNVRSGLRALLFAVGLAAILLSGLTYSGAAFPGYIALLPTLGAALIILAGDFQIGWFRGLNTAPLRFLGDISYSLYLWHWPLIVFFLASGRDIGLWEGIALAGAALVLAHFSYRFIEQRFRHLRQPRELRPLPFGFASILTIVLVSGGFYFAITRQMPATLAADAAYPGPAALLDGAQVPEGVEIRPAATQLLRDRAVVYDSGCHQSQRESEALTCEFGDPDGEVTVALVGSSHSVNWLPAFDLLGQRNGWKIISITKSSCGFRNAPSGTCGEWHENVLDYLATHPVDVVAIGENAGRETSREEQERIAERWSRIADLGLPILAIKPIPHLETEPADCLPDNIERCTIPRSEAMRADTIGLAVDTVPGVMVVDMDDAICAPDTCGPVVGNIAVFRDEHHLTATYARALAPYLEDRIALLGADFLPVSEEAGTFEPAQQRPALATLECGAHSENSAPFSRTVQPFIDGSTLVLRTGDWRDRQERFEVWEAALDQDPIVLEGEYIEGGGGIKRIHLSGTIEDGVLTLAGERGPRECSLVWPLGDAASLQR